MNREPVKPAYESYLSDESHIKGNALYITFPETAEELSEVLVKAGKDNMKVTFQGGKTGLTGGAVPGDGLIVNLSKMNKTGETWETEEGTFIKAEAGTTLEAIEKEINRKGYFLPVDPTEKTATLGGIYATGAAGPGRLKYGDMKDYVKGLKLVTPEGEILNIERGDIKVFTENGVKKISFNGKTIEIREDYFPYPVEGDDFLDLLSGTEGYAGCITEFNLSLLKKPSDIWGVVFFFEKEPDSLRFSEMIWNENLTCLEFYDRGALDILDSHRDSPLLKELPPFPLNTEAALYTEVSGDDGDADTETLMKLLEVFVDCGGKEENTWAENGEEAVGKFRDMRHAVPSLLSEDERIVHGLNRFETDCEIHLSPTELVKFYRDEFEGKNLKTLLYGHILEGRLHSAILPETGEETDKALKLTEEIFRKSEEAGGYGISENGIGQTKRKYVLDSLNEEESGYLESIRQTFDSGKIMNPRLEDKSEDSCLH